MWLKTILYLLLALFLGTLGAITYGNFNWQTRMRQLRTRMDAGREVIEPCLFDTREIENLPQPVQRYFHASLQEGQPVIAAAQLSHQGSFNMSESAPKWNPFTSTQRVITRRPAFEWDGRIRLAPGLAVLVRDSYFDGKGTLHAKLLGLFTVADLRDTPEVAQGELLRFLAEAVWYPTALLPSQGIRWEEIDDESARAFIEDQSNPVSLEFRFGTDGLVREVYAEARYRAVDGELVATPWKGTFSSYEIRHGMQIPMEGEVSWLLSDGPLPYWRGHLTKISYDFAP